MYSIIYEYIFVDDYILKDSRCTFINDLDYELSIYNLLQLIIY